MTSIVKNNILPLLVTTLLFFKKSKILAATKKETRKDIQGEQQFFIRHILIVLTQIYVIQKVKVTINQCVNLEFDLSWLLRL